MSFRRRNIHHFIASIAIRPSQRTFGSPSSVRLAVVGRPFVESDTIPKHLRAGVRLGYALLASGRCEGACLRRSIRP